MDGIDFLNGAPLILSGLRPCQSPKLTFSEHLWVAPLAHPHCSSGNNPNLVLYELGKAGVQRRLNRVGLFWSELCHRQSLITAYVNRGQSVLTAGMITMIFCTRPRHAVFPIHRINLQWAMTNSRSLRLTYAPFPTFLNRGNLWTCTKIAPNLPDHAAPLSLIAAQFTITAVQLTFVPDWSRFSDWLRSGTDRSPVEWGYKIDTSASSPYDIDSSHQGLIGGALMFSLLLGRKIWLTNS